MPSPLFLSRGKLVLYFTSTEETWNCSVRCDSNTNGFCGYRWDMWWSDGYKAVGIEDMNWRRTVGTRNRDNVVSLVWRSIISLQYINKEGEEKGEHKIVSLSSCKKESLLVYLWSWSHPFGHGFRYRWNQKEGSVRQGLISRSLPWPEDWIRRAEKGCCSSLLLSV